jgi:transcriptional regulator with XRE-family HTH domain
MTTIPTSKGDLEAALGAQFRDTRRANQVWLRDLSKKLGVSVNTVRWHEAGARMMRTDLIVRAAEIIGVPASELVVLKREPDTQAKDENDAST